MWNYFKALKRALLAIISLLSISSFQPVKSALFTHNLNYTPKPGDNSGTLFGRVTFDSSFGSTDDFLGAFGNNFVAINRSLVTNITFTYTPDGGDPVELTNSDITGFRLDHTNNGSTDYSNSNIKSQFTVLQFYSSGAAFELDNNDGTFGLQAATDDDFTLNTTTYHSPGPLPLFGLFAAFSSIKKLKSKYKSKFG